MSPLLFMILVICVFFFYLTQFGYMLVSFIDFSLLNEDLSKVREYAI